MHDRSSARLEQAVQLAQVPVLDVQVEVREDVERVGKGEAAVQVGRERGLFEVHEADVRGVRQCPARPFEHPLRDVESPQLADAWSDSRGDAPTADTDLGDRRVRTQIREHEVVEHALDVVRRAPLVADEPDVLLAPSCGLCSGQLDVQVRLVLSPVVGVRVPQSPVALDVAEPRQDHTVEVQLADAAHEGRADILATAPAGQPRRFPTLRS